MFWLVVSLQKCKKLRENTHLINMVKLNCSKFQMTCQNHNKTSAFLFIKVMLKSKIKTKEDIIGLIWTDGMVLKIKIQLLHSEFVSWLYNQEEKTL